MTEITVTLSLSDKAAQHLGPDYQATLGPVAEKEGIRLFHVERCKPKLKLPRTMSLEQRFYRTQERHMLKKYSELYDFRPDGFEEVHGEDFRKLSKAAQEGDIETIKWFCEHRPWQDAEKNSRFPGKRVIP